MAIESGAVTSLLDETRVSSRWLATLAERVPATGDDSVTVRAPAVDEPLGTLPVCTESDVERAVERAREAQREWAATSPDERAAILERFGDSVLSERARLLDLLQLETGKSRRHGVEETLEVPLNCTYYADRGPELLADEERTGAVPGAATATVTYEPDGVVGVITPWNYPVSLAMSEAVPALLAGNAVVLKPDEETPFVALALAALLERAGLPEGLLTVVTGDPEVVGPAVVERVDHVAFTGSTATGRIVAEQAGRNLVDASLELGGNNPLVVLDDADISMAARGAAQGAFANAGQLCLAPERLYVHESVYEEFLEAFVGATRRLSLGTGFDYEDDVGSLVNADQLERVERHVDDAVADGASVLTGGRHRPDVGPFCYEPTILTDVDPDSTVACEETFGPVVSVTPVPDTATAVEAANDSPYGLNASVWTGDRERGERVAREIDCGTVCVNDAYQVGWAALDAPMGGFGDSGLGRRHGPEGIRRFLEARTVATSRIGPFDTPPSIPTRWTVRGLVSVTHVQRTIQQWFR